MKDDLVWVGKNKGNDDDKLLLAGRHDKGGYHIAMLLDFCLKGLNILGECRINGRAFEQFRETWKPKETK